MEPVTVEAIKKVKRDLGIILVGLDPNNDAEWKVHDQLTAAHKSLRSIDISSVAQMPFPPAPAHEPEETCPTCKGEKTIKDGNEEKAICPQCEGRGKVPAASLQGELESIFPEEDLEPPAE
jgi:hypothetical protein